MSAIITFTSSIANVKKFESYTQNPDGSFDVILGALNSFNRRGDLYPIDASIRKLFEASSTLQDRIHSNTLYGEANHPDLGIYRTEEEKSARYLSIDMTRVSHLITAVSVDDTPTRIEGQPEPVYLIRGKVVPHGKYGEQLKENLTSKHANTAFSIRSLTANVIIGGVLHRRLVHIITWDWVHRPGINSAYKDKAIAYSSEDFVTYTSNDIHKLENMLKDTSKMSIESEDVSNILNAIKLCKEDCFYNKW